MKNWKDNDPDKETAEKWSKDPNKWIWGMLYYNKEDKRLFVSKRVEWMGTTYNFANPKWIPFMTGTILFFGFVVWTILR